MFLKIVWFCKIRNWGFSRVLWKGGSIENDRLFAVVIFLMGCWLFGPQVNALVTCIHCIGGLHCTDWIFGRKDWGHQASPHRLQTDRIWDCGVVVKVPDQVGLLCYGRVVEGHTSSTCYLIKSGRKPQQWNCLAPLKNHDMQICSCWPYLLIPSSGSISDFHHIFILIWSIPWFIFPEERNLNWFWTNFSSITCSKSPDSLTFTLSL